MSRSTTTTRPCRILASSTRKCYTLISGESSMSPKLSAGLEDRSQYRFRMTTCSTSIVGMTQNWCSRKLTCKESTLCWEASEISQWHLLKWMVVELDSKRQCKTSRRKVSLTATQTSVASVVAMASSSAAMTARVPSMPTAWATPRLVHVASGSATSAK